MAGRLKVVGFVENKWLFTDFFSVLAKKYRLLHSEIKMS